MNLRHILSTQMLTQLTEREKGKLPSQPVPNPNGQINYNMVASSSLEQVQSVITLRTGKQIGDNDNKNDKNSLQENEEQEKTISEEVAKEKRKSPESDINKYVPKAPFPQ